MSSNQSTRRRFLGQSVAACGAALLASASAQAAGQSALHVSCNQYPWSMFYRREKRDFATDLNAGLAEVAASGMNGFEPGFTAVEQVDKYLPLLKKHGLEMRSLYINSTLHDTKEADKSVDLVLAIAERAKPFGTRIIVTNPTPLRWGGPENKTDAQLIFQAQTLDRLGAELRSRGQQLAYHNHDIELRNAAREFHHMLLATDPRNVALCLDAHWVYRGAGNSSVALFDVLKTYGSRVVELHLRQSREQVWTEVFGEGDIDYRRLAEQVRALAKASGIEPLLVLEQAPEKGTPQTCNAVEAHHASRKYVDAVFGG